MGGSSKPQIVGYQYSFDIHMGLGLPLDEIVEIRAADKRAWRGSISSNGQIRINAPELFGGDKSEGGLDGTLDVLFGEESQPVHPRLAAFLGGIVPAFRGITTAFYSGLVTSMNPYPKTWEILRRGGDRLWRPATAWYPEKQFIWLADNQIKAMNPAHILYLLYTGQNFRGLPRGRMDEAAWRAAADTLYAEQLGLCLEWRRSDSFKGFRDNVLMHMGAEIYLDRRTALISIRLLRDDYDPASLPLFDEDSGLLEVKQEEATSSDEVPSQIIGKYTDAIDGKQRSVRAVNSAVAQRAGGRSSEEIDYFAAPTGQIAGRLAQRDLRIKTSGLKSYKVVLDRRGSDITPGMPFRIRSRRRGIEIVVVRAGKIQDGTLDDGRITVTALQDVFGLPASSYVAVPPSGWTPPDRTPQAVVTRRLVETPYREIAGRIDPANLELLDPTTAFLAALALAPTQMSQSYTLTTRVGSTGDFIAHENSDWCPNALLVAELPISAGPSVVTLASVSRLDQVVVGTAALIDNEIVRVDAINTALGTVTLARACVDTVPALHAAGARVWFYDGFDAADETAYTSGVTLQARLLTNTSIGRLDPVLASTDSLALTGRQGRPYAPGQFRIGGVAYPSSVVGDVVMTWTHRDRLGQADQLIDTTMGNIGPEAGTTYSARLLRADTNAVLTTQTGISGTTATLTTTYVGQVIAEVWAVRSGIESLQRHRWAFNRTAA
ncbi:hypothetical protein [Phytopseudomonas daroniae]|uniref:hypothetical protein n=1 Tax=Phytopseudomonas daroniae TaxID=2487519 RepID=UPI0010384B66|nr:hypothetical protein [Pseudomonas daroniae]TBU75188.1 hypothetical protein DNK10_11055 [Pseudomonas daroniae]